MSKKKKIIELITTLLALVFIQIFGNILIGDIFIKHPNLSYNFYNLISLIFCFINISVVLIIKKVFKDDKKEVILTKKNIIFQILFGVLLFFTLILNYKIQGNESNGMRFVLDFNTVFDIFTCFIGIAVSEEYVYRIFIYNKLIEIKNNKIIAIIISSILFGLAHYMYDFSWMVASTIMGLIFSITYTKFKDCSFLSLVIGHGLFDFLIKYLKL